MNCQVIKFNAFILNVIKKYKKRANKAVCSFYLKRKASFAHQRCKQKKDAERCTKIGERSEPIFTSIY
ncbi:hypothetical protein DXA41_18690 [Coprobacillus cateniformis]|nr:hypothetical protein DXA41_18690 [Coprobacillus cateniformis]